MPRPPALVDAYGRPLERGTLKQEIAGPTITGVRTVMPGYPGDGLTPRRLASILREADAGEPLRYCELAEQIEERDLHYVGVLGTRKRSVAQLDITVEAASDDKIDVDRADMVRDWLKRDELQDELFDILDAVGKGYSFTEIMWDTSEKQWRPGRLLWRDPRWFRFDRNDGVTPLLRTEAGDVPLPGFKFIQARFAAKTGVTARSGLARIATWAYLFKKYTERDWAIFTQTYGQPVRIGKYGAGATDADKDTLFNAVANIAGDCAAIIPDSMVIDFVEAQNVGAGSALYKERADWFDQQISKAVLGQTTTTDAISGGHAVSREHRQVQEDIERADARTLSAIINRDLIRPWIDLEFGVGEKRGYPRVVIARAEAEDLDRLSRNLSRLVPLGLRVGESEIRDKFGLTEPANDERVLTAPAKGAPGEAPPEFQGRTQPSLNAEQRRQGDAKDAIERLAAGAEDLAAPGADALIESVRSIVDEATSLEDLRERLAHLAGDKPAGELASLMRLALTVANLEGRADIGNGIGNG